MNVVSCLLGAVITVVLVARSDHHHQLRGEVSVAVRQGA